MSIKDISGDFLFHALLMPRGNYCISIGRANGNDIIIAEEHISAFHVKIAAKNENLVQIEVLGRNGISFNGRHYDSGSIIEAENSSKIVICKFEIIIGYYHSFILPHLIPFRTKFVEINPFELNITINREENKLSGLNRTFMPSVRKPYLINSEPIELDMPPVRKNPDKQSILLVAGPALTMVIPILLGSGRKVMIIAGFIAATWAGANVINRRNKLKKEERRRRSAYSKYVLECEEIINERYRETRNIYISTYPPIDEYLKGGGNVYLIWNRGENNEDRFNIRIGIGRVEFPAQIKIPKDKFTVIEDTLVDLPKRLKEKYEYIEEVPICINMVPGSLFAISTRTVKEMEELIYSIIIQICLCLKPSDVKLIISAKNIDRFKWSIYLPHLWEGNISLVKSSDRRNEILNIIDNKNLHGIAITDDLETFSDLSAHGQLSVIFLADRFECIPPNVDKILQISESFSGIIGYGNVRQTRENICFDRISLYCAKRYSRMISSLSDHVYDSNRPIPERILLTDLCSVEEINPAAILRLWDETDVVNSLAVPIGMEANEKVLMLDIDEKGAGPHGLIAGTTGSGKSEMLQTFILSLAMHYPPSDVSFFLIDYKGGGMANAFMNLPHLAGSISNLSGAVIERAMVSIRSELEFRQRVLANSRLNNIRDYQRSGLKPALSHIVIIIDEFAELKREEPEFMHQLVSVAQVGRSLGVHLILSTQKPAGCVDDKIWSNSRFRICLKVRDKMDSNDMLHRPDAAYITNIGRAYLQVGNDEYFSEFQCAYSSADIEKKQEDKGIYIYDDEFNPVEIISTYENSTQGGGRLQIDALLEAISQAHAQSGAPDIRKLWLDELPDMIFPDSYEMDNSGNERNLEGISLGIYDDPANQASEKYYFDIYERKNTVIVGSSGSGKSYLLLRMLLCFNSIFDTQNLGYYILDFGGKRLEGLKDSKMCGGYICADEYERIQKLLRFISDEIKRRQQIGKSAAEPAIAVIIDNYGSMSEYSGAELDVLIFEMMRVCASVNVYFIISANNIGQGELPARIFNNADSIITLCMKDKYSYSAAFSVPVSMIPAIDTKPGRGLVKIGKRILAMQCYMPVVAKDEMEYENIIASVIKTENKRFSGKTKEYPYIPKKPVVSELSTFISLELDVLERNENGCEICNKNVDNSFPIGYIEESGHIFNLPVGRVSNILISGRKRSGRGNTLNVIDHFSGLFGYQIFRISTIRELSDLFSNNESGIVLCNNVGQIICDFYSQDYDVETEKIVIAGLNSARFLEEGPQIVFIGVISPQDKAMCIGRKIWNVLMERPYAICLGGSLEEQSMFDFSFMNFSQLTRRKGAGRATVAFYDDDLFFGDVVIPLYDL